MRQVYELSANLTEENKNEAVQFTLQNAMDRIEGPATLNVVRVRCPTQFHSSGTGTVSYTKTNNDASTTTTTASVAPFNSPAEALRNYEDAFRFAAIGSKWTATSNSDLSVDQNRFRIFFATVNTSCTLTFYNGSEDASNLLYQLTLEGNTKIFSPVPLLPDDNAATGYNPDLYDLVIVPEWGPHTIMVFSEVAPVTVGGTAGTTSGTARAYEFRYLPKVSLENMVLKVENYLPKFVLNDVAERQLSLGHIIGKEALTRFGKKSPSFNDVRRIVMTLTPTTQRIIAMDASSTNKIYDNASISFTVDDDPTDNSPMAMYSLVGDFLTNSLQIEGGTVESMSVHLQRCIYNPTTGVLGRPEALYLPATNNFVEVKLVADDEPTAKRQRLPSQQPLIPSPIPSQMQRQPRILPGVPTPQDMRG